MLHEAGLFNEESVEVIHEIIRAGDDVNQFNEYGYTPLAVASATGNPHLVCILLEHRADPTVGCIGQSELPLHHAARFGHKTVLDFLLPLMHQAGMVDKPNRRGEPPLHLAAAGGHFGVVKALIRARASPVSGNWMMGGVTPLHAAAADGNLDTIEFLLDQDAPVDATDRRGRTPLQIACLRGDADLISLLLRFRANPLHRDSEGSTPLDLVPVDHPARERAIVSLRAFSRPPPEPIRTDASLWSKDARSIL